MRRRRYANYSWIRAQMTLTLMDVCPQPFYFLAWHMNTLGGKSKRMILQSGMYKNCPKWYVLKQRGQVTPWTANSFVMINCWLSITFCNFTSNFLSSLVPAPQHCSLAPSSWPMITAISNCTHAPIPLPDAPGACTLRASCCSSQWMSLWRSCSGPHWMSPIPSRRTWMGCWSSASTACMATPTSGPGPSTYRTTTSPRWGSPG